MIKRLLTTITFVILIISSNAQTNSSDTLFVFQEGEAIENNYGSEDITYSQKIDRAFTPIVDGLEVVLFWDPFETFGLHDSDLKDEDGNPILEPDGSQKESPIPLVVIWLIFGAVTFTILLRFINFRGFKHAIMLVRGVYDDPDHKGEVSHFQALTTALSATVGLGNIAGVAIAISIGGPGATFWMIIAGLLGMSSKFIECTLGVKYRIIDKNGVVSGGPMYYLRDGLKKKNMKWLGLILSFIFSILVIGGSLGGGNMFQSNQAFSQLAYLVPSIENHGMWFGIILAILVGFVIIGGIKSIARVTDKIVPFMAVIYVATALVIIIMNIENTGNAFRLIIDGAFGDNAMKGGLIGVLIIGFQRAAFSNEAGVGSAAIAHSAVKTNKPITEGFVSLLEPFVDTVVICTMTALVLIYTGTYENPMGHEGAQLTSMAFAKVFSWFPYVLMVAIFLFAFSTMISWSYYGLKGFDYLLGNFFEKVFGNRDIGKYTYFVIFLFFIVVGSSSNLGSVIAFSDMMILAMAFPNIIGLLILSPEILTDLNDYWRQLKAGEIKRYK
ncbi:MAG: amino acid carrier protein [Lentimicrobiaceae bacterium]|jgi:AGCS family alanine or glycine:cation symporter|nr:amino acid carrier protein [Lentimicrobiaceae bacterium]MBT3454762.1 amino acid carrier protein [Lentimicrobiaceae bacterium]MBT3819634.1 amino acid carrier protein [Lentimicrobiaceae bacterium]MBT4061288.1 amino acid carrier protein [Lentimicrobiaceae bacterium]MBT4191547.1 amino acid carrier protein [Lentimicrobiaceae bacterium]